MDRMEKDCDEMRTMLNMLKAALEEKHEGPSLSSSRSQTLHGGEAQATPKDVIDMLPFSSSEALQQFDELLQYLEYRKPLLDKLKRIGGETHKETVHNCMSAIIRPELATSLSWTGKGPVDRPNTAIGSLRLTKIVMDASFEFWKLTDHFTKKEITKWLAKCKRQSRRVATQNDQTQLVH
ncbi:uncharacterized protein LOC121406140 [Lytechinus variegatus]|uniref:uncharacterized protein LOC121406140 n=1 Tax=Lytechinus variegatus TaxID=7654 RepID=UPI001BB1B2AA|nr:uncharacterized protein LOC121406140 [Lytechinus variegatus]